MKNFKLIFWIAIISIILFSCEAQQSFEDEEDKCSKCELYIADFLNKECYGINSPIAKSNLKDNCADYYDEWELDHLIAWAEEACEYNTVISSTWSGSCTEEIAPNLTLGDWIPIDFYVFVLDTFPGSFAVKYIHNGTTGTLEHIWNGGKSFEYLTSWNQGLRFQDGISFDVQKTGDKPTDYSIECTNREEKFYVGFKRENMSKPREIYVQLKEKDEENKIYKYEFWIKNW